MQGKAGEMLTASPCLFTQTLNPNCIFRGKRLRRQVLFGGPGVGRASAPGADFVPDLQRGRHPFSLPGGGGSSFVCRCRLCLQVAGFALCTLGSEVRPPPPQRVHHMGREGMKMGG